MTEMRGTGSRAQVIAVFANRDDWQRVAPRSRALGSARGLIHVTTSLVVRGAVLGATGVALLGVVATALVRASGMAVPSLASFVLAACVGAVAGAIGGALLVRRAPRSVERDLDRQRARGLVEAVIEAPLSEADTLAHELERQGALEATVLPEGVSLDVAEPAPAPAVVDHTIGGTLVAGEPLIASAVRHLGGEDVRLAVLGRARDGGPVHSSTSGPAVITGSPGVAPLWWRALGETLGAPRRLGFADGEILVVGEVAPLVVAAVEAHTNDAVLSALARLAERLGCPDASARVVLDAIDSGHLGVVLLGTRDARHRAVELLSFTATAVSEGNAPLDLPAEPRSRVA